MLNATSTVLIEDFLAQPLMAEVAAGQEVSFYNVVGGDRGEVINPGGGEVNWAPGQVEARVLQNGQFAGIFESVNHVKRESLPLDLNALLPPEILPQFQQRATAVVVNLEDGSGSFKIEVKSPTEQFLRVQSETLTGGPRQIRMALPNPPPANVQIINLITDGAAGNFFVASRIALETTGPDLGEMEPFVWSYANLLSNYDPDTGLVRDRANFPSGDFDNVSATGGFALASVLAAEEGVITPGSATSIVEKVTQTVLNLPKLHGVLPHFVRGGANPEIVPPTEDHAGTEWSSLDTVLTYTPILIARQALGLSTEAVEQALIQIDWDNLILPNGTISHGYSFEGQLLPSGWDTFGGETFMTVWAQAASRPGGALATVISPNPPTFNGSGFIDELAALYLPMPELDVWGNNLPEIRAEAAMRQVAHYSEVPICCASAGEVPEPWTVEGDDVYQALGVGGRIPDNDGTDLLGHLIATPHYGAMIASLQPEAAAETWEFLKSEEAISPLNVVESVYVVDEGGEFHAVWNPLKGSWNLLLTTLGYARALAGEENYLAYEAARDNGFVAAGINRISTVRADLTGDGFVDFEDLTVLLAAWNQNVSAAEGNLVDAAATPVNFEDLTVLLAAWTGPGPAGAPVGHRLVAARAAVGGDSVGDFVGGGPSVAVGDDSYRRRDEAPRHVVGGGSATGVASYRERRDGVRSRSASGTYGRLQAVAVDRAMEEETMASRRAIVGRRANRRLR